MKKTVVFGGTFNPFHFGHLKLINEVISTVRPDRFILMPAHLPPHKIEEELLNDSDRLEILRLAASELSGVEVSDYEIKTGGKSYTVNTLEYLHRLYPDEQLYFAMGSDMLISFLNWYRAERILELAVLVCNCRDESEMAAAKSAGERIAEKGGRCVFTECEPLVCSSTTVRERIKAGLPITDLVPKPVADYIERNGLYRGND